MNMSIGKKFGLIVVFVLIFIPFIIVSNCYYCAEIKKIAKNAYTESVSYADELNKLSDDFKKNHEAELKNSMNKIDSLANKSRYLNLFSGIFAGMILLFYVSFIIWAMKRKINSILNFTANLVKGDFTSSIEIESNDEIAQIADQLTAVNIQTCNVFKDITNGISTLNNSSDNLFNISERMK